MNSFQDLDLNTSINTSDHDIIAEFFVPLLKLAKRYDRGVGFFSSGWLKVAAEGMVEFADNGGRARWVTSPILSRDDWEAIKTGDFARENHIIKSILEKEVENLFTALEENTRAALAWMIADEIITIKLALPRNKLEGGEFHDKFGIFTDSLGNQVSFNGSYNDSIQGTRNYESFKIFWTWDPALHGLVELDENRFEDLWNGLDLNVKTYELPTAIREKIVKLRSSQRPYKEPNSDWGILTELGKLASKLHPAIPQELTLRDYQVEAIEAWSDNNYRGILEMATGTGKTITALSATVGLFTEVGRMILVVSCPYKHLVDQWAEVAHKFGFRPLKVVEASSKWKDELANQLRAYRKEWTDLVAIIITNSSLKRRIFQDLMEVYWEETVFIVDEVHHAGAEKMMQVLPEDALYRLGLSATPIRQYDEYGTEAILDYFGPTIFHFGLKDAIGIYLTEYYYYPKPVEMMENEFVEYCKLTRVFQRLRGDPEEPIPEAALRIAIKRARVQNNSISKLDWIRSNIKKYDQITHTLFYVGEYLFNPTLQLLGIEKGIRIHEFTQRQDNKEREELLKRFSKGELNALIAMKCLDEGVDVPPTRTAYFLASSSVSREFVQRRGRILRLSEGKSHATIIDLISIPPSYFISLGDAHPDFAAVRASVGREYRRIKEFAELAVNKYQALDEFFDIVNKLDLITA